MKEPTCPVEAIFRDVAMMRPQEPDHKDPYKSKEYAEFVESMTLHCRCCSSHRPCDGVLAGGVCDEIGWRNNRDDQEDQEDKA